MLIRLYAEEDDDPGFFLTLVKAFFFCLTLFLSCYFFFWQKHMAYGFAALGIGLTVSVILYANWPTPVPILVLNDDGILDRRSGFGLIEWKDIVDVQIETKGPYLCLRVENPEAYIAKLPQHKRKNMEYHQSLGFRMLNLDIRNMKGHPLDLLPIIRKQLKAAEAL